MRTLHAGRCVLEPQVEAHAPAMFAVLCDPAIYAFERVPPPSVEALARGYRRLESRRSPDGQEQWLNWVVRLCDGGPDDGALTGYVQATVRGDGLALVAYEFHSRFWRRGIGSTAVAAMADELVLSHGVTTLAAVLKRANYRSMGLLRRLGFTEGTAAQAAALDAEADETAMLRPARPLAR